MGKAGQLLDDMLAMIGLDRTQVYIANIVKCRPPQNRDPLPAESEACMPWLREQFRILRPKIVVCLGRIAEALLRRNWSEADVRGIMGENFLAYWKRVLDA